MEKAEDVAKDAEKQTPRKQRERETDTDETDGEKTGQDTSRQAEGTGRCYRHIWTEKQSRVHANHSVCFGESCLLFHKDFLLANIQFVTSIIIHFL